MSYTPQVTGTPGIVVQKNGNTVFAGTTVDVMGSITVSGTVANLGVPKVYPFSTSSPSGTQWLLQPAADTVFSRTPVDLIGYSQANIKAFFVTSGFRLTGTFFHLKFSSPTQTNIELASSPNTDGHLYWVTGTRTTGWFNMNTGAFTADSVMLSMFATGGNATVSPQLWGLLAEFR